MQRHRPARASTSIGIRRRNVHSTRAPLRHATCECHAASCRRTSPSRHAYVTATAARARAALEQQRATLCATATHDVDRTASLVLSRAARDVDRTTSSASNGALASAITAGWDPLEYVKLTGEYRFPLLITSSRCVC